MVKILTEEETLQSAAHGVSLSRFGDGELRVALGGTCYGHREKAPKAVHELRTILLSGASGLLVCLPRYGVGPNKPNWDRYATRDYLKLYGRQTFGSAFVSRPDSAPWIDTPKYWEDVEALWRGKDVTLVAGSRKSLTPEYIDSAAGIRYIECPEAEAYGKIDAIEEAIGNSPRGPVIMCAGVTATILAWRLAKKGIHALDLGHIGMFMKHAGAYRYVADDLTSGKYRKQLHNMHKETKWGGDGKKHVDTVVNVINKHGYASILDYGCGRGTLNKALTYAMPSLRVSEYDPGIAAKAALPKPAPFVVCTDVLEHVEPDKIAAVLEHLRVLAGDRAYFVIATREANAVLPDGRNAHLTVQPAEWWVKAVEAAGFTVERREDKEDHEVRLWLKRSK